MCNKTSTVSKVISQTSFLDGSSFDYEQFLLYNFNTPSHVRPIHYTEAKQLVLNFRSVQTQKEVSM